MSEGSVSPVSFSGHNLVTADLLWRHMQRTGEIFSPFPEAVGRIVASQAVFEMINSFDPGEPFYPDDTSVAGSAYARFTGNGKLDNISIPPSFSAVGYSELLTRLLPQIADFAEISYRDAVGFLYGGSIPTEGTYGMEIDLLWMKQNKNLLPHWKPGVHLDGDGGDRYGWRLGHIAALGARSLHYPGQLDERRRLGSTLDPGIIEPVMQATGTVSRILRTSAHAGPLRYHGARLFFRSFHKLFRV